jgi:hypothetical protein
MVVPAGLTVPVAARVDVPSLRVPAGVLFGFGDFEHPLNPRIITRMIVKTIKGIFLNMPCLLSVCYY